MQKHDREPVKHTCPDIDKYVKSIRMEIVKDRDLKNMDEEQLRDVASSMAAELYRCEDWFEQLRDANHALRMWGIEEAEEVDSLKIYIEELELKLQSVPV